MRAGLLAGLVTAALGIAGTAAGEEAAPVAPAAPAQAAPPPAASQPAPATRLHSPEGLTLGLRAGWAKALGELAGEVDSSNTQPFDREFLNAVPFWLEAGYRFANGLTAGGYLVYGPAEVHGAALLGGCGEYPTHCEGGRTRRLGVQLTYHFLRVQPFTPWLGAGTGYEWSSFDVKDPTGDGTVTYKGWELLNLQLGGDYALGARFFLGPFVSMSYGRFSELEAKGGGATVSFDFAEKKIHSWLQLGLRARFDP